MEETMESLAMSSKQERKGMRAKEAKREKIRNLKKLVNADMWEDEDNICVTALEDPLMDALKFLSDPMIKGKLSKADYKTVYNSIVDAATVIERVEVAKEKEMLKKV